MSRILGVFGSAGFAREVMPLARAEAERTGAYDRVVFVDRAAGPAVNGHDVMAETEFLGDTAPRDFVVGISDMALRARLTAQAEASGARPVTVRAGSAEIMDAARIGAGAVLCSHTYIGSNARIGAGCHLNYFAQIAHDCVIGDFVTLAPRATCNGAVEIGDGAYLGSGCLIRQSRTGETPMTIGAGAVVGMGAVVTQSVPPGAVVAGNPARPMNPK